MKEKHVLIWGNSCKRRSTLYWPSQTGKRLAIAGVRYLRVFLDDERAPPDGWVRVYWPAEAIALLKTGAVEELSLDHDLGDDERGTGYDVVIWIEEAVALHNFMPPKITRFTLPTHRHEKRCLPVFAPLSSSHLKTKGNWRGNNLLFTHCARFLFLFYN